MIDSFIDGEIKLDEIITKMNGKNAAAVRDNRRISEMIGRKAKTK